VHREEDAIKMAQRQRKCRIYGCEGSCYEIAELLIKGEEEEEDKLKEKEEEEELEDE
jgi:hypothetical protein